MKQKLLLPVYFTAVYILLSILSCTKDNMFQDKTSGTLSTSSVITYQTADLVADSWQKQPNGNYRCMITVPPGITDAHTTAIIQQVFINGAEVGPQPIDYAGGVIWFMNYYNTGYDLFFQTSENELPFSSIQVRILILKKQH